MFFSYRARQWWKRFFMLLLYIAVIAVAVAACLLLWLRRFLVYTPDGAYLQFSPMENTSAAVLPEKPDQQRVNIVYVEEKTEDLPQEQEPEPQRLTGYYVDIYQLLEDPDRIFEQVQQLPAGTAVLVDVKNYWGYYYYSSSLGTISGLGDVAKMDALLAWMADSDLYMIARIPGFRDYEFALSNLNCAIKKANGYPWIDSNNSHWLDPTHDATLAHMIQVIKELRGLGFDEVVLQNFEIPEGNGVHFTADRTQALQTAAQALVTACDTERFTVSFVVSDYGLRLPEGNSRLYLMDVAAADLQDTLALLEIEDPLSQVVVFAQTNDTRYDICGTLHPLEQAMP